MNLWAIFLTGLTTGGLTCFAVQGGLLAGYLANRQTEKGASLPWQAAVVPTAAFLTAKLIVYVLAGWALGALGSVFQLSLGVRVALQIVAGVFMVAAALKLLKVHPIFDYFELHPPAVFRRVVRKGAKSQHLWTPALLGALTVLIPCGTTQAMEVLAISSGSAYQGALILGTFVLGTAPLFFLIGVLAHSGAKAFQGVFTKVTAAAVLVLGLYSINGGLGLAGSPLTAQNISRTYVSAVFGRDSGEKTASVVQQDGVQDVTLNVTSYGYTPSNIELKAGVPVRLHLVTKKTVGCARSFVIPKLKIEKILPMNGEEVVEFTPTAPGQLAFSCSMGMYTGNFTVI
jgi:sulfite exporter TauE/SafE